MTDQNKPDYYRAREASWLAEAAQTSDPTARQQHLDLAEQYGRVAESHEHLERLLNADPTDLAPPASGQVTNSPVGGE